MPQSIEAKHAYRFGYLRSEHWSNLRLSKLASSDARCARCGHRDLSNDVHHLRYKKLYDVTCGDLVVLCRRCHESIHAALDTAKEFQELDGPASLVAWKAFLVAWGEKPHAVHELWSLMRDMRKAGKIPKLRIRQGANTIG